MFSFCGLDSFRFPHNIVFFFSFSAGGEGSVAAGVSRAPLRDSFFCCVFDFLPV